ncbi:MAG: transglycosylase SLT domain-containing protein [Nitrospira sp.]|nr:transglycosylase SLT domain-containing protein [Nitrospira sp.]
MVTRQEIEAYAIQTANRYGVPANIVLAVIQVESGFNVDASGAAGEVGLMQLMEPTAKAMQCNRYDWRANIECGVRLLRDEFNRFGSWEKSLAAYNAGATNVQAGFIPTSYVSSVQRQAAVYAGQPEGEYQGLPSNGIPTFSVTKEEYLPSELPVLASMLVPPPAQEDGPPWPLLALLTLSALLILRS